MLLHFVMFYALIAYTVGEHDFLLLLRPDGAFSPAFIITHG